MSKYRNIKIHVPTPEISEKVQKKLFEDGCVWVVCSQHEVKHTDAQYLYVSSIGHIEYGDYKSTFVGSDEKEIAYQSILDPYYDVKIAWANGEVVQFRAGGTWYDWECKSDLMTNKYGSWRIKPKTKTIRQWERKYHVNGVVYTMIIAGKNDDKDTDTWIGEAYEAEYEVPNE